MKFLSTFKITKGFDTWLKMYKEIEPDLNELGIKILSQKEWLNLLN